MNKVRSIIYLSLFLGLLRLILLFHHNPNHIMNIDEESNYEVATNHFKGRGYTYFDPNKNDYFPTAFHSSFSIFVYENLLLKNHIHKRYWVMFCNVVSALLLGCSIYYFYLLCLYFLSPQYSFYCTLSYGLFPSVIYYIGSLFWYEQIVLSMLVIVIYLLIKLLKTNLKTPELLVLSLFIIIGSLFRIQTIALFVPLLFAVFVFLIWKKQYRKSLIPSLILLLGIAAHWPSVQKNKLLFGNYIISTQMGYEILQGHNPYAKGSWMGDWLLPQSPLYQYSHEHIPNLDSLNQYEEGLKRKEVALKWIKENPLDEIKLTFRKLLLFFLPRNFEFLPFNQFPNPINFVFYLGFIGFIVRTVLNKMQLWSMEKTILVIPVIGALGLCIIFFMGARWRYYAEPFMIICAFIFLQELAPRFKFLKNKFEGFQK